MKVLKYGEGYPKTITCVRCNSELEYNTSDIFYTNDIYEDRIDTFWCVKCPVCGKNIPTGDIKVVKQFSTPDPHKKKWWRLGF